MPWRSTTTQLRSQPASQPSSTPVHQLPVNIVLGAKLHHLRLGELPAQVQQHRRAVRGCSHEGDQHSRTSVGHGGGLEESRGPASDWKAVEGGAKPQSQTNNVPCLPSHNDPTGMLSLQSRAGSTDTPHTDRQPTHEAVGLVMSVYARKH
jgi:hypothetical protein